MIQSYNTSSQQVDNNSNQNIKQRSGCFYYLVVIIIFYINFNTLYFFAKLHSTAKSDILFVVALFILFILSLVYQLKSVKVSYYKTAKIYFLFIILHFTLVFLSGISKSNNTLGTIDKFSQISSKFFANARNVIESYIYYVNQDQELVKLEKDFIKNPSDPVIIYNLAIKYISTNNMFYAYQAVSLLETLVELIPCDEYISSLADAYSIIGRYDLAYLTVKRRLWLPYVTIDKIARQLALISIRANDLQKGINEIQFLLELALRSYFTENEIYQISEEDINEVKLILASLYLDFGDKVKAKILAEEVQKSALKTSMNYKFATNLLSKCNN